MTKSSIRKRRRDRTKSRIKRQHECDRITRDQIDESFQRSSNTWGGTRCPECGRSVPARAFVNNSGFYGNAHILCGDEVGFGYCYKDKMRCHSEAAKEGFWEFFNSYKQYEKGTPSKASLRYLYKSKIDKLIFEFNEILHNLYQKSSIWYILKFTNQRLIS